MLGTNIIKRRHMHGGHQGNFRAMTYWLYLIFLTHNEGTICDISIWKTYWKWIYIYIIWCNTAEEFPVIELNVRHPSSPSLQARVTIEAWVSKVIFFVKRAYFWRCTAPTLAPGYPCIHYTNDLWPAYWNLDEIVFALILISIMESCHNLAHNHTRQLSCSSICKNVYRLDNYFSWKSNLDLCKICIMGS